MKQYSSQIHISMFYIIRFIISNNVYYYIPKDKFSNCKLKKYLYMNANRKNRKHVIEFKIGK